jgi:hypothetical protein
MHTSESMMKPPRLHFRKPRRGLEPKLDLYVGARLLDSLLWRNHTQASRSSLSQNTDQSAPILGRKIRISRIVFAMPHRQLSWQATRDSSAAMHQTINETATKANSKANRSPSHSRSGHVDAERKYRHGLNDRIGNLDLLLGEIAETDLVLHMQPKGNSSKAATLCAAADMLHQLRIATEDEVKRKDELRRQFDDVVGQVQCDFCPVVELMFQQSNPPPSPRPGHSYT